MTPDDIFNNEKIINQKTFIYFPAKNKLITKSFDTHGMMYKNMQHEMGSKINGFDGLTKKDIFASYIEKHKKLPPSFADIRFVMQSYGDVLLGRVGLEKENMSNAIAALWPTKKKEYMSNTIYENIIKEILELNNFNDVQNVRLFASKEPYDASNLRKYKKNELIYKTQPNIELISKTKSSKEEEIKKTYVIDGEIYTHDELVERRAKLHLLGMAHVDKVLCAIDQKKYPELFGFIPTNCERKPEMKPLPFSEPRGKDDWRGNPIWKRTSESFSQYVESQDLNQYLNNI